MASRRVRPAGGYELAWWYFMRISGLILVILALGHLFIMHILHNVEQVNYAFVANRWADPTSGVLWRLWDLTMVNLAVLHGINGLREILYEYIVRPSRRILASTILWSLAAFLIVIGTYAILLFQSDTDYLDRFEAANPHLSQAVSGSESVPTAALSPALGD
jgi:succinate dehydrogenase / fumarate reductase membrane anchor subunit